MRAVKVCAPLLIIFSLAASLLADSHVRIVRLSLVVGAVQVKLPDGRGWRPALLNAPLVQGEQVRTLGSGRAEIQFENGSTLRLIPGSQVTLSRLALSDAGVFETTARVTAGTAFATLRQGDSKGFRIALAGHRWAKADGDASLRVNAAPGAHPLEVLAGKAKLVAAGRSLTLKKNQAALFTSGGGASRVDVSAPAGPWTKWSETRDQYYAVAFHEGVQPGGLTSVVNWNANLNAAMPGYSGVGLDYVGATACPWTMTSGDYSGWCWSSANGWYFPAAPPTISAQAAASVSDVSQTNSVLAGSSVSTSATASPFNVMFYGGPLGYYGSPVGFYGGALGFGAAGMFGAPLLCDALCMDAYYGPNAFLMGELWGMGGGYYPAAMPAGGAASLARTAQGPATRLPMTRNPLGLRPGGGNAAILRPPPAPRSAPPMENRFGVPGAGASLAFREGLRPSGVALSHSNFRVGYRAAMDAGARFAARSSVPSPAMMSPDPMASSGGFSAGASPGSGFRGAGPMAPAGGAPRGAVGGGRVVH